MIRYYIRDYQDNTTSTLAATFNKGEFNWVFEHGTVLNGAFDYMFYGSDTIKQANIPYITDVMQCLYAFTNCKNLRRVDFPDVTTLSFYNNFYGAFLGCTNLDIYFPKLQLAHIYKPIGSDVSGWCFENICDSNANVKIHLPSALNGSISSGTSFPDSSDILVFNL